MKWAAMAVLVVLAVGCSREDKMHPERFKASDSMPQKAAVLRDHNGKAWIVTQDCFGKSCVLVRVPEVDTHGE
ncbi:hypothetical protein CPT_Summit_050 [Stenotrophomonas phage Summit]|nr:hypothetical protein CPT_Summit_050 [Stenotrophomonas phage Summit]